MVLCSNGAKSYYGRIVLLVAALCLYRWGASKPSVFSIIHTIHGMNHHIWMAFGDLTHSTNCQMWGRLVVGTIGQGNGAGPQIWAAMSSPLFDIM